MHCDFQHSRPENGCDWVCKAESTCWCTSGFCHHLFWEAASTVSAHKMAQTSWMLCLHKITSVANNTGNCNQITVFIISSEPSVGLKDILQPSSWSFFLGTCVSQGNYCNYKQLLKYIFNYSVIFHLKWQMSWRIIAALQSEKAP